METDQLTSGHSGSSFVAPASIPQQIFYWSIHSTKKGRHIWIADLAGPCYSYKDSGLVQLNYGVLYSFLQQNTK
jgi:hypothetical protein